MSWASIASNQTISFTNLKDACTTGVFTEAVTIPTSNEQVTAADVATYTDAIVAGGVASSDQLNLTIIGDYVPPVPEEVAEVTE